MASPRLTYVDIARGIAIVTVIAYHTDLLPLQHQLLPLITPWMLPVFALLYGMTTGAQHTSRSFMALVKARTVSLLLPYLFYGLLSFVIWFFLRWYAPGSVLFVSWQEGLWQLFTGVGIVYNGPLWFLPSFFVAAVLFAVVREPMRKHTRFGLLIMAHVLAVIAFMINPQQVRLPFSYDVSILFAAYMCVGAWIAASRWERVSMAVWQCFLAVFVFLGLRNGTVDIFFRMYGNPIVNWITAIVGSMLVLRVSAGIDRQLPMIRCMLSRAGKDSMVLFAIHWPLMQYLTFLLSVTGLVGALGGTITYTSFSYYHPSAIIFTLIELPLLLLYFCVPFGVLWLLRRLGRTN